MTDVLWPTNIIPSSQTWGIEGNVGVFQSPLSGAVRTVARTGSRMKCTITLPPLKGQDRARITAFIAALRDRSNRAYVPDFSTTRRGSISTPELLTNNDFSNGTTGWTATRCSIAVTDQVLRATNSKSGGATNFTLSQTVSGLTQYAPYVIRSFVSAQSKTNTKDAATSNTNGSTITGTGLMSVIEVVNATSTSAYALVGDATGLETVAGDYVDVAWSSMSRPILADAGLNALLYSDQFDNAAWAELSGATIAANNDVAPDGPTTGDVIHENSATAPHFTGQQVTVSASAADYCLGIAIKPKGRTRAWIQIVETSGSTAATAWINLSTGAVGTTSVGANWLNIRAFSKDLGNGWWGLWIVARKTNAATTLAARVGSATTDGVQSYTGTNIDSIACWRATLAQSSAPVRLTQTTSAALASGTAQTGSGIYVKGLPVSTSGLLKAGDMVQLGNQINIVTAPLDSDAAGLGYLQCGNPWRAAIADNDSIIVNTPMAKMILASEDMSWETGPGQFSPFQLEFIEDVT